MASLSTDAGGLLVRIYGTAKPQVGIVSEFHGSARPEGAESDY